jgi:hypothetical protein
MRHSIARTLRKLADFLDPHVGPSRGVSFRLTCDSDDALREIRRVQHALYELKRCTRGLPHVCRENGPCNGMPREG